MFVIPNAMRDEMVAITLAGYPNEVCALIGGRENRAFEMRSVQNIAQTPRVRYALDPAEQVAVFDAFEASGWELVAIFHSHPTGSSFPSATDIAESFYPGVVYFIVSLVDRQRADITAWLINDGAASPVDWTTQG